MVFASLLVGHNALGSGNDGDAQTLENLGQLIGAGVDTQAGLGNTLQPGEGRLLLAQILQGDVNDALVAVVLQREGLDVALIQQNLGNGLLQVGSGDIHGFVLCAVRIADAGQHVCYGIGDLHVYILLIEVTGFTRGDPKVSGECAPL